ncbi:MAG: hypothetical protein EKK31_05320 [Hyphomicrobiales bacterium]|jgi:hypothetical protein|nr:MAG: hypothetical protein EKK31_05320 [Hyphomicrobiales bacterium]
MPVPPCSRLLILACSSSKRAGAGRIPAIERYDGPLWRTLRHCDPEGRKARVAFVSARYGFRDADSPIEAYDARLTEEVAAGMIAGGTGTRWPRPGTPRGGMPEGKHPGIHIARMIRRGDRPIEDVALVGGWLYLRVMRAVVGEFQRRGKVAPTARIVEINAPIDIMRRELRAWLEAFYGEVR